jgi:hypothetical protein
MISLRRVRFYQILLRDVSNKYKLIYIVSILLGTRQQAISAIRHLKKIIIVKSNLFLSETSMRRKFTNLDRSDLSSLVEWLFIETGRKEQDYSSICRELFGEFVKLLPGKYGKIHMFIHLLFTLTIFYFLFKTLRPVLDGLKLDLTEIQRF